MTRADVNAIAAEVWKAAGKGPNSPQKPAVDVLGWEFALEINETAKEIAAQARVDAAFKKIPREVLFTFSSWAHCRWMPKSRDTKLR